MERKETWSSIEKLLEELISAHRKQLLSLGRQIVPALTPEDILQPNDYPELENDPLFRYEEGYLAGVLACRMALSALRRDESVAE